MKDFSTDLRISYLNKMADLPYPAYDEDVNDTVAPYTRNNPPPAYYIITNQTSVTNGNKCSFNSQASIQIDCVTWLNGFNSSKRLSETMANAFSVALFGGLQADFSDMLPDWNVWQGRIEMTKSLIEHLQTQTVVRKVLIISHQIQEL